MVIAIAHIDALCHISYKGLLYNGKPAKSVTVRGAQNYDITTYSPGIIGRGVLIDVPRFRGVKWLEPGISVTREEIEAVEKAENVQLQEGDIIVLRTGHHRRRLELGAWDPGYTGEGRAGLDPYSLTLLHERKYQSFFQTVMVKLFHLMSKAYNTQSTHFRLRQWEWCVQIACNWRIWRLHARKKDDLSLWSFLRHRLYLEEQAHLLILLLFFKRNVIFFSKLESVTGDMNHHINI